MVVPDTFNDDVHVVVLFNVVVPDTFNDDVHVVILFNIIVPDTYNELFIVVLFDNVVKPDIFKVVIRRRSTTLKIFFRLRLQNLFSPVVRRLVPKDRGHGFNDSIYL